MAIAERPPQALLITRTTEATAPSSPKPEEGIPPDQAPGSVTAPPPGSGAPAEQAPLDPGTEAPDPPAPEEDEDESEDDEEEEADEDEEESGAEEAEARAEADGLPDCIDIDRPDKAREKDGYISGLIVGTALARMAPHKAEAIVTEMVEAIARGYRAPEQTIWEGVEADARALLAAYAESSLAHA